MEFAVHGWENHSTHAEVVWEQTEMCLKVYAEDPSRVLQDANNERRISQGGYARRQLEELAQNAVDAARDGGERIEIVLSKSALYVANDGFPFDATGVRSIMASDISTKDDQKIGKFGIGFKSVLAVSQSPRVFSRTVSFSFDKEWSEATLKDAGYESEHYPAMRLAKTLDPSVEAAQDPVLADLMSWASTVVVLPLTVPHFDLSRRLYDFPAEFILFSPHIARARLRNLAESDPDARAGRVGRSADREITQSMGDDDLVTLRSGREVTRWSISRIAKSPSRESLGDAGHVAGRMEVELQYALPVPAGSALGAFWAYFPTSFNTTLAGLVNAPWKLSDDRTGLLAGAFNHELLDLVPRLFGDALSRLDGTQFAVASLDAMPARGKEDRNWADEYINAPVFEHLRTIACLPDGVGRLRVPRELKWVGDAEEDWLNEWASAPGAPADEWVHPDLYRTPERRNKVERLLTSRGAETVSGFDEWLEALVKHGTVQASASAIALAAMLLDRCSNIMDQAKRQRVEGGVRTARIVRLESGELKAPDRGRVFVRVEGDDRVDVSFVDPALAAIPGVRENLAKLGVVVMDRTGELHALLAQVRSRAAEHELSRIWSQIWPILREIPQEVAIRALREDLSGRLEHVVAVRTATGGWGTPATAYLAGAIIPADGSRDREALIDPAFHRDDADLLREIGAVDAPVRRHDAPREEWLDGYEDAAADLFLAQQKGAKPDRAKLVIEGSSPPWPLQPLTTLSDLARAAATEYLVAQGLDNAWLVKHSTNGSYGRVKVIAPEAWFLRRHGRLRTSFGLLATKKVLAAGESINPDVLPAYVATSRVSELLALKSEPAEFTKHEWAHLKEVADKWVSGPSDDTRRTEFYTWLPGQIEVDTLVARVGQTRHAIEVRNIGIATDESVYESMLEAQIPALLVPDQEDADRFIALWEMPRGSDLLQEEIVVEASGEASYVTDLFPPLKLWLQLPDQDLKLQPASRLEKMVATQAGQVGRKIHAYRDGVVVYVTAESPEERLRQLSRILALGMSDADVSSVLASMAQSAAEELKGAIRAAADDDSRLVEAVGVDALRRIVPAQAISALENRPAGVTPFEIALLARAVHGVSLLKQLRPALEERGLEPPREWAGRRITRSWVRALGFPDQWAGFPESARPAVEMVDGPAVLDTLHPYQVEVTERITALLRGVGKDRGMVSLPTGAGKTRVTVEALVDGVRDGDIATDRPLVWIAQTDELCEQAAETWTYVWRAVGPRVSMRLGRLWASNELGEEPGAFQLVVATIDKLDAILKRGNSDYDWLRDPTVVVIDEAHASISPAYTSVLDWLGRSARSRRDGTRRPLIGLSATPFRGTSAEETQRLVNRYDGNRLDRGSFRNADDPYGELQEMKVLATVRQQLIDGTDVVLTAADMNEIERTRRLPSSVTERLGADLERTLRIVDSISGLPTDWTVLAFAPSVENARVLAALLSHRGVPAVSVSSETEPAARRHYIEEFKAGRIRVLTNYGVLTQGFDAPRVRAVYLTRPTFSPNVYQQMVGRGLRGPLNGGSEEVLVVNVRDNFEKYGELLAFNEFEYLWTRT